MYQKPQFWKLQLCPLCTYFQAASRKHGRSHSSNLKMNLTEAWPSYISLLWLNPSHTVQGNHVTSSFKTSSTVSSSSFFWADHVPSYFTEKPEDSRALSHALIIKSICLPPHSSLHEKHTGSFRERQCPGPSAWRLHFTGLRWPPGVFFLSTPYDSDVMNFPHFYWKPILHHVLIPTPSHLFHGFIPEVVPTVFWINNFPLSTGTFLLVYKDVTITHTSKQNFSLAIVSLANLSVLQRLVESTFSLPILSNACRCLQPLILNGKCLSRSPTSPCGQIHWSIHILLALSAMPGTGDHSLLENSQLTPSHYSWVLHRLLTPHF